MALFDDFAKEVYEAQGKGQKISRKLYNETAKRMTDALMTGMGKEVFSYDSPMNDVATRLRTNVHAFSAAKSLTEYKSFASALVDEKGEIKPFSQFRSDVEQMNVMYNETWLRTEYDTAIAQAQAAARWNDQVGTAKQLRYKTQEDDRVRPTHAALDNLIASVTDVIWDTIYPPNDWNCRCFVLAEVGQKLTPQSQIFELVKQANVPALFKNNPGKTGIAFGKEHPYFRSVKGKLKELDAIKNYGMQGWKTIMADIERYPAVKTVASKAGFRSWWEQQLAKYGGSERGFQVTDQDGTSVFFSDKFYRHVAHRYQTAANLTDIFSKPDEIWVSHNEFTKAPLDKIYIKYYADGPYVLITSNKTGSYQAVTMYKVDNKKTFDNLRKGILMHANKKSL